MGSAPAFMFAPFGILAGLFGVLLVGHWVSLLTAAFKGREDSSSIGHRASKVGVILAIVHPVPWLLLIGVPYALVQMIRDPPADGWIWFIASAAASLIAGGVYVVVSTSRAARRRVDPPSPDRSKHVV